MIEEPVWWKAFEWTLKSEMRVCLVLVRRRYELDAIDKAWVELARDRDNWRELGEIFAQQSDSQPLRSPSFQIL